MKNGYHLPGLQYFFSQATGGYSGIWISFWGSVDLKQLQPKKHRGQGISLICFDFAINGLKIL